MSTVEPLYNRHHWDQQTCPFNRGVLCWGVIQCNKVSKWDKISVWLPLFRGVLYKGFHCACTQCIQSLIDTHTHTHTHARIHCTVLYLNCKVYSSRSHSCNNSTKKTFSNCEPECFLPSVITSLTLMSITNHTQYLN